MKVWPGKAYPLGATFDGTGTNFSLFSEAAEKVKLCLFDDAGSESRVDLPEVSAQCWHGYLPDVRPGQRYGYRVHGPWAPEQGHRCNPAKLLIDPYAKEVDGKVDWNEAVFPHRPKDPESMNDQDSAPYVPKCVVIDPSFGWGNDKPLERPLNETMIYEVHVKGFTAGHPDIPSEIRGTYAGLAHPAAIEYFVNLGVTAIELLPVHQFVHDAHLLKRGLRNYWGYNSIGYFAPHSEYASKRKPARQVHEFKQMVKTLHEAGLEVILDVVYNHTAEGNHLGPMFSFKGIDNAAYYHLVEEDRRYYMDFTGTGNSLNVRHPHVLQLIMDSLRYWVLDMHVDGFRFDLASTLARELHAVNRLSSFFDLVQQDPVVSQVKLIAEPWDLGEGGYQVGNFPPLWSEWNGKYRDCVRDFWREEAQSLAELGFRFTGSSDLYENTTRKPMASINFITAHDGFTLHDLVSYNEKHNEGNGEENKDGENQNRSWNCGEEGPSSDPDVLALRDKQKRNFLGMLFLSQGVPMLLGGDEIGRTQRGNNNAYCQDNEISWFDWKHQDETLLNFTRTLLRFRSDHPVFMRRGWFIGRPIHGSGLEDIGWFAPDGTEMADEEWKEGVTRSIAVFLNGRAIPYQGPRGEKIVDDSFMVIFNAYHESISFRLPEPLWGKKWIRVLDTAEGGFIDDQRGYSAQKEFPVQERSMVLLRRAD